MQEENFDKEKKKFDIYKQIVSIVAVCAAILSVSTYSIAYFGPICALIALIMGIIVLKKKMDGKVLAVIALILGIFGLILGGNITAQRIAMRLDLGDEVCFGDGEGCVPVEEDESNVDTSKLEALYDKMTTCLDENGIDSQIDFDDLADEQQLIYTKCLLESE